MLLFNLRYVRTSPYVSSHFLKHFAVGDGMEHREPELAGEHVELAITQGEILDAADTLCEVLKLLSRRHGVD